MRFLYNTWVYLDVLSSLSSGEDPFSLKFFSSTLSPPSTPSSSAGEFSLKSEIDSLLGCAVDLFPLIARMSKVANRLTEKVITYDEVEFIREAIEVRDKLLAWRPPEIDLLQKSADTLCQLDDIVRTAEVYRLTALLHLYRTFPPLGRDLQNLADQILNNLLVIPKESHSLCIHIWPLMASGCEQTDPVKRHKVFQRFDDIRAKLMIANVDQAIDLLGEVWRRRDAGDRDAGWAKLAKERDWHLLLG
jgi:Fungal specific transcription factor domain